MYKIKDGYVRSSKQTIITICFSDNPVLKDISVDKHQYNIFASDKENNTSLVTLSANGKTTNDLFEFVQLKFYSRDRWFCFFKMFSQYIILLTIIDLQNWSMCSQMNDISRYVYVTLPM
jgi:hypothetical protein